MTALQLLNTRTLHPEASGLPLVLIHGLFGASENLLGIGRVFPGRPVLSVDLRNHGRSFHAPTMTFAEMAADVARTIRARGWSQVDVVGHSLGGKVAIQLAQQEPDLVRKLVVADIAPVAYPPGHREILAGLHALDPSTVEGRREADQALASFVPEGGVRSFLLMNLVRNAQGTFEWRFNLPALFDNYETIRSAPDLLEPFAGATLYLRGGESAYVLPEYRTLMSHYTPHFEVQTLEGCGHWLHAEKPAEFNQRVQDFLAD
jgi:esterase